MKKTVVFLCAVLLCACSNESTQELASVSTRGIVNEETEGLKKLQFSSEADFNKSVGMLAKLDGDAAKQQWVKGKFGSFESLKDVYDSAMVDTGLLDESEQAFMDYKNKYANILYFSNYLDDCGAYLPVSNKDVAYLLNKNGEVSISGQVVNKKDIASYSQLQDAGMAMYEKTYPITTRAWGSGLIPHSNRAFVDKSNNVGQEFDTGWWKERKRKIRFKCGRKVLGSSLSPVMKLHVEVSFRKKTWLGWANYSSITHTKGSFTGGYDGKIDFYKHADSSHDWYQEIPHGETISLMGHAIWHNPAIKGNVTIEFRGIGNLDPLQFSIPNASVDVGTPNILRKK